MFINVEGITINVESIAYISDIESYEEDIECEEKIEIKISYGFIINFIGGDDNYCAISGFKTREEAENKRKELVDKLERYY